MTMLDSLSVDLWTTDRELRITSWHGPVQLGWAHTKPRKQMSLAEFLACPDPEAPILDVHRKALLGETDHFFVHQDARRMWGRVAPLRDDSGRIAGTVAIAVDVTCPAAPCERRGPAPEPERSPPLQVLLVEADERVRRVVARLLERGGHTVIPAADVTEALAVLGSPDTPPDLVVSEFILPGGSGWSLVRQARRWHPGLGVVLMSGSGTCTLNSHHPGELPPVILGKPFDRTMLDHAVARARPSGGADPAVQAFIPPRVARPARGSSVPGSR